MSKKSKLYTRTGDKGYTSLVGGQRVSKSSVRLESYGTVDELNSFVGLLMSEIGEGRDLDTLLFIQNKLFSVGSYLATDQSEPMDFVIESGITAEAVARIEGEIDRLDGEVPPMKSFVLPSGSRATAAAHVCRTVARRAERRIYALVGEGVEIEEQLLIFVNRLSDYFFILARCLVHREGVRERCWDPTCK